MQECQTTQLILSLLTVGKPRDIFSLSTVLLEWDNYCAFLFLLCRTDLTDANHRLDAVQRQLRDLQGSRNNKLKLFGSWVPELLQRVDQAAQRGKFHHKPVGPIGKRNLFWSSYCWLYVVQLS